MISHAQTVPVRSPDQDELDDLESRLTILKESYGRFVDEWERISKQAQHVQRAAAQHIDRQKLDAISKHIQSL